MSTYDQPAFQPSPESVFEQIRKIIKGYPDDAVLRELIQNADDAGATTFVAAVCGSHLLNDRPELGSLVGGTPFLVVANDGAFNGDHRHAIRNSHISRKDGDDTGGPASVGKFGLGLKSLFNWCEVFFGFHLKEDDPERPFCIIPGEPTYPPVPNEVKEDAEGFNIAAANRWRGLLREQESIDALTGEVTELTDDLWTDVPGAAAPPQRLVFIVPLRERTTTPEGNGLREYYPVAGTADNGGTGTQGFWDACFTGDWDRIWPLLIGAAHLSTIKLIHAADPGDGGRTVLRAHLAEGQPRPRRQEGEGDPGTPVQLEGEVELSPPQFARWHGATTIPTIHTPGAPPADTTQGPTAPDKAPVWGPEDGHVDWPMKRRKRQGDEATRRTLRAEGAVWIYDLPPNAPSQDGAPAGPGEIALCAGADLPLAPSQDGAPAAPGEGGEARWACGLPLAGASTQTGGDAAKGRNKKTQLVLHGSFEVDSERTSLVAEEKSFGKDWNRWLITTKILPLLSGVVGAYVTRGEPTRGEPTLEEQKRRVRGANDALDGLQGPSIKDFDAKTFWKAVRDGGRVLPVLEVVEGALKLHYRHVPSKVKVLKLRLEPGDWTPDGLGRLSRGLPGLCELLTGSEGSFVVMVDAKELPTFPKTMGETQCVAWTGAGEAPDDARILSLRPSPQPPSLDNSALEDLIAALRCLAQHPHPDTDTEPDYLWGGDPSDAIKEWLRSLLALAFDGCAQWPDALTDARDRKRLKELATVCGAFQAPPPVTDVKLETRLRRRAGQHESKTLLLPRDAPTPQPVDDTPATADSTTPSPHP